ncbi:MAG: hypothetical protein LBL04_15250, partial [Bacteroidales bacterium]|nr:hypothetical protein [Bacteroidales bacterium]
NRRILAGIACIVLFCFLMPGCTGDKKEYPVDETIYLNYKRLDLYYGDEVQLTVSPGSGVYLWESGDNAIASISQSGALKTTGKGATYIAVTNENGIVKEIPVVVTVPSADRVTGRPGAYRAAVEVDVQSELIKEVRITRMNTNETQVIDVGFQARLDTVYFSGLAEGSYQFNVVCTDKFDMESDPVELTISVYGAIYESTVKSRSYNKEHLHAFGNGLYIIWEDSGIGDALEFTYTDRSSGEEVKEVIEGNNGYLVLYGYATYPLTDLSYVTIMRPSGSIDDFRSQSVVIPVSEIQDEVFVLKTDGVYLKNSTVERLSCLQFDIGGEGIAFHDNGTMQGNGKFPRQALYGDYMSDFVDFENGGNDGTNIEDANLGFNDNGEWHAFTVYVEDAGTYAIDPLVGLDSQNVSGVVSVDGEESPFGMTKWSGSSWSSFKYYFEEVGGWENVPKFTLEQGFHRIVYRWTSGGYNYRGLKITHQP